MNASDAELCALVAPTGRRLVLARPIGRASDSVWTRSYRLACSSGAALKARRYPERAQAERVEALLELLPARSFARILARRGTLELSEWIEGRPLADAGYGAGEVRALGALLGAIHAQPVPDGLPASFSRDLAFEMEGLASHLEYLAGKRLLDAAAHRRLRDRVLALAPTACELTLIHGDLCPENVVVTPAGELCVVDNESLMIRAPAYDLAMTAYRWPLTPALERFFLEGYRLHHPSGDVHAHAEFWRLRVLAKSAAFHAMDGSERCRAPLRLLHGLLAGRA